MPTMAKFAMAWLVLVVIACTNGEETEAEARKFGAACTTVVDTGSTECDSGVCTDAFDQIGHPVCSVKCAGDSSACPAGSEGMKCNMKGYCKP